MWMRSFPSKAVVQAMLPQQVIWLLICVQTIIHCRGKLWTVVTYENWHKSKVDPLSSFKFCNNCKIWESFGIEKVRMKSCDYVSWANERILLSVWYRSQTRYSTRCITMWCTSPFKTFKTFFIKRPVSVTLKYGQLIE